jgi:hypothetical protein
MAAGMNACPSDWVPQMAMNIQPAVTLRESNSTLLISLSVEPMVCSMAMRLVKSFIVFI